MTRPNLFRESSSALAARMLLIRLLAEQAKERGETEVSFHPLELWAPADEAALALHSAAMNEALGLRGLPFDEVAS